MSDLTDRLREVHVTLDRGARAPAQMPKDMARLPHRRQRRQLCRYGLFRGPSGGKCHRRFRQRARDRCAAHRIALDLQDPGPGDPRRERGIMIWHIFKKDWKLLWPLVAAAAFAHAVGAMLWWVRDHAGYDVLQGLAQVFPIAALLACGYRFHRGRSKRSHSRRPGGLAGAAHPPHRTAGGKAAVHSAGGRRTHLLVSIGDGLLYGFSLAASTEVSVSRSLALLVQICLPAMLLGAMTRNLVEALLAALIAVVAGTAQVMSFLLAGILPTLNNSGLSWWFPAILSTSVVGAALIILPMQYFRRANGMSRLVVISFFLLALSGQYWPWNWVFFESAMVGIGWRRQQQDRHWL